MNLRTLLDRYSKGKISINDLQRQISIHSIERVANETAQLDVNREIRKEIPEVIFAKGKDYADLLEITIAAAHRNGKVLVSKVQANQLDKLCRALKKRKLQIEIGKNKCSTILVFDNSNQYSNNNPDSFTSNKIPRGKMGILAAGTSDVAIAEEVRLMAKAMECLTIESYDVGIAGIHRLFPALKEMISQGVGAIVVVAGMEGALPSVVTSMVNIPVIGVPTSVGYGFGSDGIAALASMLQSCTPGMSVVNIDNGIGAGAFGALICNRLATTNNEGQNNNGNNSKSKIKSKYKYKNNKNIRTTAAGILTTTTRSADSTRTKKLLL
ncbi:MAG TPA: nickel pincer cofactor biosynthesis protein LarB [Nitrososphaeraceae archaeon]|nr:nickel pincer cofactor biosynthesis protein LarB [Nitrososphaeraceae archaeon]